MKKQPNKLSERLEKENEAFLARFKIPKKIQIKNRYWNMPDLTTEKQNLANLSNNIPGSCFKRSIDDYKWKRETYEKTSTIKQIEEKKKRLAPMANKMPYQYITDETDPTFLGKK